MRLYVQKQRGQELYRKGSTVDHFFSHHPTSIRVWFDGDRDKHYRLFNEKEYDSMKVGDVVPFCCISNWLKTIVHEELTYLSVN